jgi:hypothetical protein
MFSSVSSLKLVKRTKILSFYTRLRTNKRVHRWIDGWMDGEEDR